MNVNPKLLVLLLVAVCFSCEKHSSPVEAPAPLGFECPEGNAAWRSWRDKEYKTFKSYGYTTNAQHMGKTFNNCQESLERAPEANTCLTNLKRFTTRRLLEKTPGHSLGLEITDGEYLKSVPSPDYFALPKLLQDQTFLRHLDKDDLDGRNQAYAMIDQFNQSTSEESRMTYLQYQSLNLPTPDDSLARTRLLLLVPHPEFNQYIQFGLRDSPEKPLSQSVSMIAVEKISMDEGVTREQKAYFNDFYRVRGDANITFQTRLESNQNQLENCSGCHNSPLIPIFPDPASFDSKRFGRSLIEINEQMKKQRSAQAIHFLKGADGPHVAEAPGSERLTDTFIAECSTGFVSDVNSLERVRKVMNCSSCHNGVIEAPLTYSSLRRGQLPLSDHMVRQYVVEAATMPPGASLSRAERQAVVACLEAEYSAAPTGDGGLLEKWFVDPGCVF